MEEREHASVVVIHREIVRVEHIPLTRLHRHEVRVRSERSFHRILQCFALLARQLRDIQRLIGVRRAIAILLHLGNDFVHLGEVVHAATLTLHTSVNCRVTPAEQLCALRDIQPLRHVTLRFIFCGISLTINFIKHSSRCFMRLRRYISCVCALLFLSPEQCHDDQSPFLAQVRPQQHTISATVASM